MSKYLLSIDQGTTSSRAVIFNQLLEVVASSQQEFPQIYPNPGWVEHDPEEIWLSVKNVCNSVLKKSNLRADQIFGLGITNQRETTLLWDSQTGKCVCNGIVWQDRRTAKYCLKLQNDGLQKIIKEKTGLRLDPYFSASKLAWMLNNVDGARELSDSNKLLFGTVDSFLLWRLTGGKVHATDATNASRTLLFNIHTQEWDDELLKIFNIPRQLLPKVKDCAAHFGDTVENLFGAKIPILSILGDQQAALIGQAGFKEGMTKCTFGTGCFAIANTEKKPLTSKNKLLTTVATRLNGSVKYALEGSIFVAGSAIQWLRDELMIIKSAAVTEEIANRVGVIDNITVVPAFAGLGAPHWNPNARGAILGLTRGTSKEEIITATIQSVAFQAYDLHQAMADDGISFGTFRVDGGMASNDWFIQFLSDILNIPIERPKNIESTVLGVGYLTALSAEILKNTDQISLLWECEKRFEPLMGSELRELLLHNWSKAVNIIQN
jgi:glycerol kinase